MDRLTARRNDNGLAYLVGVKPNEQAVDSPHPNTLRCILDCFQRLAEYEDTGLTPGNITYQTAQLQEWQRKCNLMHRDNAQLRAENGGLRANSIIQEQIIANGRNPLDADAIIKLTLENAQLRQVARSAEAYQQAVEAKVYDEDGFLRAAEVLDKVLGEYKELLEVRP